MSSKDNVSIVFSSFTLGVVLGLLLGLSIAFYLSDVTWKGMAVERGYAQYNQTTGDWEWKYE